MSWKQQGKYWSRPLDCHDRFFQAAADMGKPLGREHYLIMGNVRLDFPSDFGMPGRLREAWKALRFRHPDIALELHNGEKRYYPVSDERALDDWCNSTCRIEEDARSADDLFTHKLWLSDSHATCHWIPASSQLVLVSGHHRWDGIGQTMMLHELLSELESPSSLPTTFDGEEAKNLTPTLSEVLGVSTTAWESSWEKRADELLGTFLEGQPSIGLPQRGDSMALPGNTLRVEQVVSADITAALRKAAREQGITMTTAMHASAIVETACANPGSPASRFTSLAVFSLRKHCPEPFDGNLHAPSLRVTALPINIDARAPWRDITGVLHPIYHQSWTVGESEMLFVRMPWIEKLTMLLTPNCNAPPPSEPNLNSLGVIERFLNPYYGSIAVEDFSIMGQMLSPQLYVHCWSWNGKLHMSASFNEAYYTAEYVDEWLAAVRRNLTNNLGVTEK
ncbi:uncharacterized protein BDW43DRAFT_323394 [Aspergillus alliaceus]|uniref:uncharacterized protein n=1 Tax=Petromyces alliaceus TaxID=209559 RepID=UPI0012A48486|nr:uncharacterized protein BDW43DRAFT_323394 [Aspergillus alliaceus]KAB8227929.1 hypothetical protein BDW43DRAFT_323394 [Aspergillus alliaceus]